MGGRQYFCGDSAGMIDITCNGDIRTIPENHTLLDLVAQLCLQEKRIAIEVNQNIVSRSRYPNTTLRAGDKVEIVHAIGGG